MAMTVKSKSATKAKKSPAKKVVAKKMTSKTSCKTC